MAKHTDNKIRVVFETVEYQLISGALMAAGVSVQKYRESITPLYPISSTAASVVIIAIGLSLSLWALFHGLGNFAAVYGRNRWQMYIACGLLIYLWGFVVSALFLVAANA